MKKLRKNTLDSGAIFNKTKDGIYMKQTLKDLRIANKKTVQEVASVLGVRECTVRHYENGIRCVSLGHVLTLAELYGESERDIILAQINSLLSLKDNLQKR